MRNKQHLWLTKPLLLSLVISMVLFGSPLCALAKDIDSDAATIEGNSLVVQDDSSLAGAENLDYTFTSLDDETLSTRAEGRPKILVFVNAAGCSNSTSVVQSLAADMPPNTDVYVLAFSQFTNEEVASFAKSNGREGMKFAADGDKIAWAYIRSYMQLNRITTPVIMYIDANNLVQGASQGYLSKTQLRENLSAYCGVTYENDMSTDVMFNVTYRQTQARSMLQMVNDFRTSQSEAWYWNSDDATKTTCSDLSDLTYDYGLEEIAMQRAAELVLNYGHGRPNGSSCFSAYYDFNYPIGWAGENIAMGQDSAQEVFTDWREDNETYSGQGHRRNMLSNNFSRIGIACVELNGFLYWVQEFGSEPTGKSAVPANDSTTEATVEVLTDDATVMSLEATPARLDLSQGETIESPTLQVQLGTRSWEYSVPVAVKASWASQNESVAKVSDSTIVATGVGSTTLEAMCFGNTVQVPVEVTQGMDGATVSVDADSIIYDGTPKEPKVKVTRGGAALMEGKDYSVSYSNNVNADEATATVTGMGNYRGTATAHFAISPESISDATCRSDVSVPWTGSPVVPDFKLALRGQELVEGVDYEVKATNNVEPGTATATIVGKGNYCDSMEASYTILNVVPMYRLYNPWSGEHLFTTDKAEYERLGTIGWNQEDIAWYCPRTSERAVYRLYNPYTGDHFYTGDEDEYEQLGRMGWNQEGVSFYSANEGDDGAIPIYRLFNPWLTAGTHLFTSSYSEYVGLCVQGWSGESIAFYGIDVQ